MSILICPPTELRFRPKERQQVQYAVSYRYNGGVTIGDEWYEGFKVDPPLIDHDYGIIGIGVGLELNAKPPLATGVLKPVAKIAAGTRYLNSFGEWVEKQ